MKTEVEKRILVDMLYGTDPVVGPVIMDKYNKLVMAVRQIQNILIAEKKMRP